MSDLPIKFVAAMNGLKSEADALQAENDRLQTIKATIRVNAQHHGASDEQIDRLVDGRENFVTWMQSTIQGRYSAAQAEIARLTAALAQSRAETQAALAGCVKIKPLEWEDPCERNNWVNVARSIFGEYYVSIDGGRHTAWLEANVKPYENLIGEEVGSVYAAQKLAQADYEARILAAIQPDTSKLALVREVALVPEVKALIEAATPFVSPVQNADYGRQLRQYEALRVALRALASIGEGEK